MRRKYNIKIIISVLIIILIVLIHTNSKTEISDIYAFNEEKSLETISKLEKAGYSNDVLYFRYLDDYGDYYAGSYIDEQGQVVICVKSFDNDLFMEIVEMTGSTVISFKKVRYSYNDLIETLRKLDEVDTSVSYGWIKYSPERNILLLGVPNVDIEVISGFDEFKEFIDNELIEFYLIEGNYTT